MSTAEGSPLSPTPHTENPSKWASLGMRAETTSSRGRTRGQSSPHAAIRHASSQETGADPCKPRVSEGPRTRRRDTQGKGANPRCAPAGPREGAPSHQSPGNSSQSHERGFKKRGRSPVAGPDVEDPVPAAGAAPVSPRQVQTGPTETPSTGVSERVRRGAHDSREVEGTAVPTGR